MKSRAIIPLVVGLGIGLFAIKSFVKMLNNAKGANSAETVEVVRTQVDIPPAVEITEAMVELVSVSKTLAPQEAYSNIGDILGRVPSQSIPKGSAVVPGLLTPKGTPAGMASRIPEGYRAVAVKIDEVAGVAGWLKPGSRVDVVMVMSRKSEEGSEVLSKVILQNIEVLAVGQEIGGLGAKAVARSSKRSGATLARSVTLLVKPADVPKLHLAGTKGKIQLAMRSLSDSNIGRFALTTDNDLLGLNTKKVSKNSGKLSSFISGLFGKQPKINQQATDKDFKLVTQPQGQYIPGPGQPWKVEVISGGDVYEVWFEDDTGDARRIKQKYKSRKRQSADQAPSGLSGGLTGIKGLKGLKGISSNSDVSKMMRQLASTERIE